MRKYRAPKVGDLYPSRDAVVRDKEGKIKGKAITVWSGEVPTKKSEKEES